MWSDAGKVETGRMYVPLLSNMNKSQSPHANDFISTEVAHGLAATVEVDDVTWSQCGSCLARFAKRTTSTVTLV